MMYDILEKTAWKMNPPIAYGSFHLWFLVGGILICILLAFLLRNVSEKANKIILLSIGSFLLVMEIYKQLFYTYYIGNGEYQWWIFPFQLCSIPMYLCLIIPFIKNECVKRPLYMFLCTYNLLGGFVAMFEPSGLSHEYWTLTLHAYIWHLLIVFIGFYIIASNRGAKKPIEDFYRSFVVFFLLCVVAQIINIVFRDTGLKMFYISPYNPTPIIVFKDIEAKFGWATNMIVYCTALSIGAYLFNIIGYAIYRARQSYIDKKYWRNKD